MGPQYTGSRISRDAAEDEDSDDPFTKGFVDEESEDDEDAFANYGNGVDIDDIASENDLDSEKRDDEENNFEDGDESFDEDLDGMEGMGEDASESGDSEAGSDDASEDELADETSELREMMKDNKLDNASKVRELMNDKRSLSSTLAAAAQSDVAKGQAIKTQRKTFDSLLNSRIRMQKAMISTNSMTTDAHQNTKASDASIEAAEAAALTLINNLTNLRASLDEARTGQKRKRTSFALATASSEIWENINEAEAASLKQRKTVLEKWSAKTKGASATSNTGRLNTSAQQTLTDVLDSQLANSTHLITRTQTPRSCAPLQASSKPTPDPRIYDDADFYGLLLKELLEQRSADLSTNGAAEFVVQAPWQVAREAKTKKVVDTKASKGRRLRYTVHEKLQNFMAPEERGLWGERQRDELFGSLFGQRLGLGENDEVESEQEDEMADAEEQGLMLFRS